MQGNYANLKSVGEKGLSPFRRTIIFWGYSIRAIIVILTVGLFFLSVFSPVPTRGAGIDLTFQGDILSASLKGARLKEILEKLEREKGISWRGDSSLLEGKITVPFRDLSFHEGVKRILGSMNHCPIFNASERLASVIIFC